MKFKYSAFIENTPEMREWLEKIGITQSKNTNKDCDIIFTHHGDVFGLKDWNKGFLIGDDSFIDCLGNPELFKAVTDLSAENEKLRSMLVELISVVDKEWFDIVWAGANIDKTKEAIEKAKQLIENR